MLMVNNLQHYYYIIFLLLLIFIWNVAFQNSFQAHAVFFCNLEMLTKIWNYDVIMKINIYYEADDIIT